MTVSPNASPAELFDLSRRVAIVTGASSGLGVRFVRLLHSAGATVVAAARREERLRGLYAGIDRIEWVACDVADPVDRERLVAVSRRDGRRVDLLVNNAGVSGALSAEEESPQDFARVLEVNLTSCYALARDVVGSTPDPRGVSIINVVSILGLVSGAPVAGAGYAASKAGLIGLTRELAGQWGRKGVRVNALAPGWFESEMTRELFADDSSDHWFQRNTMLGRAGTDGELDTALLMMASPHSTYLTGQVIVVDGGWTAR